MPTTNTHHCAGICSGFTPASYASGLAAFSTEPGKGFLVWLRTACQLQGWEATRKVHGAVQICHEPVHTCCHAAHQRVSITPLNKCLPCMRRLCGSFHRGQGF